MTRRILGVFGACVALVATGCGDNTRACGQGTEPDTRGFCVPSGDTPPTCTDGTILDPETNRCVIDPASCQNGTVLINNHCVDPTEGLFPDVQEGPEPNGFGLGGESSTTPAGSFMLKPVGAPGAILHGTITPRADRDDDGQLEPDYDTYLVDVTAPTLLRVTADGVHGLAGGFLVVGDAANLDRWIRIGTNLTGDTAKRTIYLPSAGRYAIAIADSRTLALGTAVGDASTEYYVTIEQTAVPMPEPLTVTSGVATITAALAPDETRFYTVPMGLGLNEVELSSEAPNATAGLVVSVGGAATDVASEAKTSTSATPAYIVTGGIEGADTTLLVVEPEINTASTPTAITLKVTPHDAVPLASASMRENPSTAPGALADLAQFYFDATAGELVGLDLAWSTPVDGVLLDEHGAIASAFSWDAQFAASLGFFGGFGSYTWNAYRGVFRAPATGRYYFLVYDPFGTVGEDLIPTGTRTTVTAQPIAFGTPLTAVATTALATVTYDYAGNASPWQRFDVTASPSTNGATALFYDAATTSGRLGSLQLEDQFGGSPISDPGDGIPLASVTAPPANAAAASHVMLGEPQHLIGIVSTATTTGTFDIGISAQTITDLGTQTAPSSVMMTTAPLDATTFRQLFLLRTAPNNVVTIVVHPTTPTLDVEIVDLAADETARTFVDAAGDGGDETLVVSTDARGYVAIQVDSVGANGVGLFDISIAIAAPYYTTHASSAAWANACTMGTDISPADRDDGLTSSIPAPAGFDFFGAPATAMRVSTNGWLTFDTVASISGGASRTEQRFPNPTNPDAVVAAYWDDLDQVRVCTKTIGTKTVVQWRGVLFADPSVRVAAQAILDTSDDSIELVYAPYSEALGTSASAGVEDAVGARGTTVFYRQRAVDPASAVKLTPP